MFVDGSSRPSHSDTLGRARVRLSSFFAGVSVVNEFLNTCLRRHGAAISAVVLLGALSGCQTSGGRPGNPSPVAGGSTSQQVNQMADNAAYQAVSYRNASRKGPGVVILPGQIKSNNATFLQTISSNNIADFAELEMGRANFPVLERTNLGSLAREVELAYNMGDAKAASRVFQRGSLKTTRFVLRFDILKAEKIGEAQQGFDGSAVGNLINRFGRTQGTALVGSTVGTVKTDERSGVWLVGMRYKIMDAKTSEQIGTGYMEEKMEVGATSTAVMGVKSSASGGVGLDTLVQRLVQKCVSEIDANNK